jgi:hypothetical protein
MQNKEKMDENSSQVFAAVFIQVMILLCVLHYVMRLVYSDV